MVKFNTDADLSILNPNKKLVIPKEQTTDRYKYTIEKNDHIAFDHPLTIVSGISRIKNKLLFI